MRNLWRCLASVVCAGAGVVIRPAAAEPTTPAEFAAAWQAVGASNGRSDAERLQAIFALSWRQTMVESPEAATYTGYPGQNDRWSDLSAAGVARQKEQLTVALAAAESVSPDNLSPKFRLQRELFLQQMRDGVEGVPFRDEWLLLNQMGGIQQDVAQTLDLSPKLSERDYADRIARLRGVASLAHQTRDLLDAGLKQGVTPPRITLRDVPDQLANQIPDDPAQSPLYRPFVELPKTIPAGRQAELQAAALAAITNVVYPEFRSLRKFLVDTYIPGSRESIGMSALPNGAEWYAHRVRHYTTTQLTPDQIHQLGLAEVQRIRGEMERVKESVGFHGTMEDFFVYLRTDPRFFFTRADDLLAGYRDLAKRIDGQLPRLFLKLPRLPYGVEPVPSYAEKSQTTAYYQPGAANFGRAGVFFANTYALNTRPKWEMAALTLHEAVPGHHLQIALAQELEGAPDFQRNAETTAFVEGWGLYSESLGDDLGVYRDPYLKFGQLTYEIWRAIRLVVDTGMHSKGWSRQQAIDFFMKNAGKSEHDITVEVDRYIVWPGQALAYKVGQLKIRELRTLAERALGARFDVRAFHETVLEEGALPLDILERRVREWISREAAKPAVAP